MKIWLMRIPFLILLVGFGNAKAQNFDTRLLQSINSQNTKYDKFWLGITNSATPIAIATPFSLYAMGHCHYIPKGKENSYMAAGGLALNTLITFGLKYTVSRERPFVNNTAIYKKTHAGTYTFPSGHISTAFATATSLTLAYPKWYVAALGLVLLAIAECIWVCTIQVMFWPELLLEP